MLEVVLDEEIKYKTIIDNINQSKSKNEFIAFLNNEFEYFKKKNVEEILSANMHSDYPNITSFLFDIVFDFETAFSLFEFDKFNNAGPMYTFFLDIYVDYNKKVTQIVFSDQP
mgnify:CR=1 FL=1